MVIVFDAQDAVTPGGSPVGVPIPEKDDCVLKALVVGVKFAVYSAEPLVTRMSSM